MTVSVVSVTVSVRFLVMSLTGLVGSGLAGSVLVGSGTTEPGPGPRVVDGCAVGTTCCGSRASGTWMPVRSWPEIGAPSSVSWSVSSPLSRPTCGALVSRNSGVVVMPPVQVRQTLLTSRSRSASVRPAASRSSRALSGSSPWSRSRRSMLVAVKSRAACASPSLPVASYDASRLPTPSLD